MERTALPDVTVKLCSDWRMFGGCKGTEYQALSGTEGLYSFTGINPGKYSLVTELPEQKNESILRGIYANNSAGTRIAEAASLRYFAVAIQ